MVGFKCIRLFHIVLKKQMFQWFPVRPWLHRMDNTTTSPFFIDIIHWSSTDVFAWSSSLMSLTENKIIRTNFIPRAAKASLFVEKWQQICYLLRLQNFTNQHSFYRSYVHHISFWDTLITACTSTTILQTHFWSS